MKQLLLLLALALTAFSYESIAKYKIKYGGFITIGEAEARLVINGDSYETVVSAKATGMAGALSFHRAESYTSKGKIIDKRLVPESLEMRSTTDKKSYYFGAFPDHENEQATMIKERCTEGVCKYESTVINGENFSHDDILTLYHNLLNDFVASGAKSIEKRALGSKKAVEVVVPEGKQLKTAKKLFDDKAGVYLLVLLNQEIFTSEKGRLFINLDSKDGVVTKAVLQDTVLFGDITGELEKKIVNP
ncbi:hypothetical protein AGMMS50229_12450 [Campylobacterota bacterium]|nr:hypothetical protein AGMMS50229_12450 [Campylobacterota bacterium]